MKAIDELIDKFSSGPDGLEVMYGGLEIRRVIHAALPEIQREAVLMFFDVISEDSTLKGMRTLHVSRELIEDMDWKIFDRSKQQTK